MRAYVMVFENVLLPVNLSGCPRTLQNGAMAAGYEFFLSDSIDDARSRVAGVLAANGFASEQSPNGGLIATRGNATRTLLLGAFAGKHTHMRFDVQFFADDRPEGDRVVARITRDLAAGALRGGVLGAARTASVFDELAVRIGAGLTEAGVLLETRTV